MLSKKAHRDLISFWECYFFQSIWISNLAYSANQFINNILYFLGLILILYNDSFLFRTSQLHSTSRIIIIQTSSKFHQMWYCTLLVNTSEKLLPWPQRKYSYIISSMGFRIQWNQTGITEIQISCREKIKLIYFQIKKQFLVKTKYLHMFSLVTSTRFPLTSFL